MKKVSLSLGSLWLGIILVITGTMLTFFGADYTVWAIMGLMVGTVAVLLYVVINYTKVKNFLVEYSTRQWANMIIFVILLLGIVIVIQMIANNYNYRFDLTSEGEMSLAPITSKVLQEVSSPVKVIGFYRRDDKEELSHLLELYSLASDKFDYEIYDLDRTPGMAAKYGVTAYGTALVEVNNKVKKIKYPSEEKIINAILNLTSLEQKVIYFFTGHGEHTLEGLEEDAVSYGVLKQALEAENYLVKTILFAGGKPVPKDAALVVIGGPKNDFSKSDLKSLDNYLKKGGGIIFAVDPGYGKGIKPFLGKYGIVLGDDIVIDPEDYLIEKDPLVPIIPFYITHPITEDFTIPTVFPVVRSVNKGTPERKDANLKSLARSGGESWAETNIQSAEEGTYKYDPRYDQKGPVTVAMAWEMRGEDSGSKEGIKDAAAGLKKSDSDEKNKEGENPSASSKMVVFGDSDFLINGYFGLLGNKDLFMNTVHWITENESLITIRKKKPSQGDLAPVYLSPISSRIIFIGVVIFLPLMVIAIGLVVAWRRRQKG